MESNRGGLAIVSFISLSVVRFVTPRLGPGYSFWQALYASLQIYGNMNATHHLFNEAFGYRPFCEVTIPDPE